jgi:hypothetical protein
VGEAEEGEAARRGRSPVEPGREEGAAAVDPREAAGVRVGADIY